MGRTSVETIVPTGRRGHPVLPSDLGRSTFDVGAPAPVAVRGEGPYLWDADANRLDDLNANFTTLVHGRGDGLEHGGSFSGNPVSMEAGRAALDLLDEPAVTALNDRCERARARLAERLAPAWEHGLDTATDAIAEAALAVAARRSKEMA